MSKSRSARLAATLAILFAAPAAFAENNYHVHVRGGVVARPGPGPAPAVRIGRPPGAPRVWVAPPRVYYRPWFYPYRFYYGYPAYYTYAYAGPVEQPYYAGPPPAAGVVARHEREPTIGLGIRGSALRAGEDHASAGGVGALLRFRARPVELELEVGWDNYNQNIDRSDTRVATSLYVPIAGRELQPYLVVGAGMNFANFGSTGDMLHQGFMDGGGGLALNFSRNLALSADVRYMVRHFFDSADVVARQPLALTTTPGTTTANDRDDAVEFRGNLVVYF